MPDVVLMDVTMPRSKASRPPAASARSPEIRVVMLTMHADESVMPRPSGRCQRVPVKDCSTDEIAATVRQPPTTTRPPQDLAASMLNEVRSSIRRRWRRSIVVTKREEEVLQLIADGCSPPRAASSTQPQDGQEPLASIYQKLDAATAPRRAPRRSKGSSGSTEGNPPA